MPAVTQLQLCQDQHLLKVIMQVGRQPLSLSQLCEIQLGRERAQTLMGLDELMGSFLDEIFQLTGEPPQLFFGLDALMDVDH